MEASNQPGMPTNQGNHYDLIVIGGGSGGLAAAKEASDDTDTKVAVFDYVEPTPHKTKWGLGGTCVNVGCIPKKLMHQAALLGEAIKDSKAFGWDVNLENVQFNWETLTKAIQDHIKSVNWVTRVELRNKKVTFFNERAKFLDSNTIETKDKLGVTKRYTADNILIAVGGRPKYPNIPGAKLGITSDDLFSWPKPPNKTLIVGAGYIGLECAGFLNGLGYPVEVVVRSRVLRGFDQQMADLVRDEMKERGVKFLYGNIKSINEDNDVLTVTFCDQNGHTSYEQYDTVLFAIGREPCTEYLELQMAGVNIHPDTRKIITKNEQTNVPHIYAVGDVIHGRPELTPVAIQAGKLLAKRLFKGETEKMDYNNVPTTVFSPLEYACVGLSEDEAKCLPNTEIEVYHAFYKPTEFFLPAKRTQNCYVKVIAKLEEPQLILGMHFIGPNAGEVVQGFAAAMKSNLTFRTLEKTVGIHPTVAEEFTRIFITKRSNKSAEPQSCCS